MEDDSVGCCCSSSSFETLPCPCPAHGGREGRPASPELRQCRASDDGAGLEGQAADRAGAAADVAAWLAHEVGSPDSDFFWPLR